MELSGADFRNCFFEGGQNEVALGYLLVLNEQVPQQQLKAVDQTLLADAQAHHREQLDPLDQDLGDWLLAVLEENVCVNLIEVHRRDARHETFQEKQKCLPLLARPTGRQHLHHRLVDQLTHLVVLARRDHQREFLADQALDWQTARLALDSSEHSRHDLLRLVWVTRRQTQFRLGLVVRLVEAPTAVDLPLKQPEVGLKCTVKVLTRRRVDPVALSLLHLHDNARAVLECHV